MDAGLIERFRECVNWWLKSGKRLTSRMAQWIPGHAGILENEIAGTLKPRDRQKISFAANN